MTTTATRRPARAPAPPGLFAYFSFAIMVAGWTAFALALLVSQGSLDDVWTAVRDLPLVPELAVWLVGFPFLLGLAIWESGWDETLRLTLLTLVMIAYTLMFVPRERR